MIKLCPQRSAQSVCIKTWQVCVQGLPHTRALIPCGSIRITVNAMWISNQKTNPVWMALKIPKMLGKYLHDPPLCVKLIHSELKHHPDTCSRKFRSIPVNTGRKKWFEISKQSTRNWSDLIILLLIFFLTFDLTPSGCGAPSLFSLL